MTNLNTIEDYISRFRNLTAKQSFTDVTTGLKCLQFYFKLESLMGKEWGPLSNHYTMKVYRGYGCNNPRTFNFGIKWR